MISARTYKLSDLEARSGFDKRTIAYYVQESLLPKVGRRGPRTRYSQEFLDRLLFIRQVRDLQDAGKLRAVTLSEIREVIESQSAEEIRGASRKRVPAERLRSLFEEPDRDTSEYAVRAEDVAVLEVAEPSMPGADSGDMAGPAHYTMPARDSGRRRAALQTGDLRVEDAPAVRDDEHRLEGLLKEIEQRARRGAKLNEGQSRERLIRVRVTENIFLSVRNLSEEDGELVEELAEILRRAGE